MRSKRSAISVLDAEVLIALALGEPSAAELSKEIIHQHGHYACTEIALCELSYILCRNSSWKQAWNKTQSIIQSSAVMTLSSQPLWVEAAQIKCGVPISLPDCFSIAAARIFNGKVIFARREKEIVDAIEMKKLEDQIEFLEQY